MARWLSFANIVLSWPPSLVIIALERDLANLGESGLVEHSHRVLHGGAHLLGAGMAGREIELPRLGHESRIADDVGEGLLQQIDAVRRRARRHHHQTAEPSDAGAPVEQARLRR